MEFIETILWPLRWLVELVLAVWHWLFTWIGMDPASGVTWVLSIIGLVVVVRSALIPITVRQIKSQRRMMDLAPDMKKIQDKYKGKKDQYSREAMSRETMALYGKHGTNPLASCLPMLVQMPIFFALFQVLNAANRNEAGVGLMNLELAQSFSSSTIFGAPLSGTLLESGGNASIIIVAIVIIVMMVASQFFTQFQITAQNISPAAKQSPMFKQQQMMMYLLPLVMAVSGLMFPIGVMSYWALSNLWTMGQQYMTIRNMPTPGSDAAMKREERLRRQGKWEASPDNPANHKKKKGAAVIEIEEKPQGQREQPVSKQRSKKKKKKK